VKSHLIEKNLEIPPRTRKNHSPFSQAATEMEPGDSILCPKAEAMKVIMMLRRRGFSPVMRVQPGKEFYRIWIPASGKTSRTKRKC
jgi:hypothetical protein